MIWSKATDDQSGTAVAFRKSFDLRTQPASAILHVFADARYLLWANGAYVQRGPARFQPNGPEYDSIDIGPDLRPGANVLALLVVGNLSGGKIMLHRPGLTAELDIDGRSIFQTDGSWKCDADNRYRKVVASWPNLTDTEVDATVEDGDWTQPAYSDAKWPAAVAIPGDSWGTLTARRIPLLRETPVKIDLGGGATLPAPLRAGQALAFSTTDGRIAQAYPLLEFSADAGAEFSINPYGVHYRARSGTQTYFTIDTRGIARGAIVVSKGSVTINRLELIERVYPYQRLGQFDCSDDFLNRLWRMCARSCEVLSEDSYVDCADRERVEWMDDDPPGFDITRTAMAGPADPDIAPNGDGKPISDGTPVLNGTPLSNGKPVYSDPRLLGEMIRRTALTLQPDGWVKAHTCSDRFDIHAKMEDRACDWVSGIRRWTDATGDVSRVREIWPAVTAQMDYFLKRRTEKGLVSARDWVVWGNPLGYAIGQTTTLNAFVQRALVDTAYLAGLIGEKADQARFAAAAGDLRRAINATLWDEKDGCYYSGYFDDKDIAANGASGAKAGGAAGAAANANPAKAVTVAKVAVAARRPRHGIPDTAGVTPTNLHANVFALDRDIVPDDRKKRTIDAMLRLIPRRLGGDSMIYYYLAEQLYALDTPEYDAKVLSIFREGWKAMVASPWDCSWEGLTGGSRAHIYGMYPGYFLSAYVLGVRRDDPVAEHKLLIEPHLAELTRASGVVVTEFGPVPVSWEKAGERVEFKFAVPDGVQTTLAVPAPTDGQIRLDGQTVKGRAGPTRLLFNVTPGEHSGSYGVPAQ